MKTLTKIVLTLLTTSAIATSAFAASNQDNSYQDLIDARASVKSLSSTLESMGQSVNTNVDLSNANTFTEKTAVFNAKHDQLQKQFDELNAQRTE